MGNARLIGFGCYDENIIGQSFGNALENREPRRVTRPCFLKIAFTELGQCAAAVIRRWE